MNFLNALTINYPDMDNLKEDINKAYEILNNSIFQNGKILTCGNGGSAADAEHIVGELMKGFRLKRELSAEQKRQFHMVFPDETESMTENLQQAIPAISLVGNISLNSAFANDINPDYIFAQQVFGLGEKGDVLIAISTSGNSKNVLHAAKVARVKGIKIIGLTGMSGGALADISGVTIKAPSIDVARIQEYHLPIYHCLCSMLEQACFSNIEKEFKTKSEQLPYDIDLVVFDFDGVFTDNKVYTQQDGTESVVCDRRDSLGINMLKKMDIEMLILSTETNQVVNARAKKMGMGVENSCSDKKAFLADYLTKNSIKKENVIYVGNDLNDFEVMTLIGCPVAPNDAHPKIKDIARIILNTNGGNGAVRELCELIIKKMEA